MEPYRNQGPVDCSMDFETSSVKGKSVIITGGANGLGKAYVQAFVEAGATVTIGDLDVKEGERIASKFPQSVCFVKCDVTLWKDQLNLFKSALSFSPSSRIDIVVANAGIIGPDPIFIQDASLEEPLEPQMAIVDVNLKGVLYTEKLSLHYFQSQEPQQDTLLIFQGSIAGYGDQHGTPQYSAAKWGLRGLMRALRRTAWQHNTRVAYIAPWAVKTNILSPAVIKHLEARGMEFAHVEDAAAAVMRLASDTRLTGRTLSIVPRSWAPNGYIDYDLDDYPQDHPLGKAQIIGDRARHRTAVAPKAQ